MLWICHFVSQAFRASWLPLDFLVHVPSFIVVILHFEFVCFFFTTAWRFSLVPVWGLLWNPGAKPSWEQTKNAWQWGPQYLVPPGAGRSKAGSEFKERIFRELCFYIFIYTDCGRENMLVGAVTGVGIQLGNQDWHISIYYIWISDWGWGGGTSGLVQVLQSIEYFMMIHIIWAWWYVEGIVHEIVYLKMFANSRSLYINSFASIADYALTCA